MEDKVEAWVDKDKDTPTMEAMDITQITTEIDSQLIGMIQA